MIHSTSPSDRPSLPPSGDVSARPKRANASDSAAKDQLYSGASAHIKAALAQHPEIRTEVVERARVLVDDPEYPPQGVIDSIARELLTKVSDEV
jgi:hypothetical protein